MRDDINKVWIPNGEPFVVVDVAGLVGGLLHPVEVAFVGATTDDVWNTIDRITTMVEAQSPDKTTTNFIYRAPTEDIAAAAVPFSLFAEQASTLKIIKSTPTAAENFVVCGSIYRHNGTVARAVAVKPDPEHFSKLGNEPLAVIPPGTTGTIDPLSLLNKSRGYEDGASGGGNSGDMAVITIGKTGGPIPGAGGGGGEPVYKTGQLSTDPSTGQTALAQYKETLEQRSALLKPLEVKGYTNQTQSNVDVVNINKALEEQVLRRIEELQQNDAGYDARSLALAFTAVQDAFMWMNRAVFRPTRVKLPTDTE